MTTEQVTEEERIRKWREERAKIAEEQKQERLKAKKLEQDKIEKEASEKAQNEINDILPNVDEFKKEREAYINKLETKQRLLRVKFVLYVVLPTLLLALILKLNVTPLYSSTSIVAVSSQGNSKNYSIAGVLSGTGGSDTQSDTYMAYEYIKSRAMMYELEMYNNFISNYSGDSIDFIYRLRDVSAFGLSKSDQMSRFVDASIDVQTGLVTLEVKAKSKKEAIELSNLIIKKTEKHINALSDNLYNSKVKNEELAVADSRKNILEAQAELLDLQISSGEQNPEEHIANVYKKISKLEEQVIHFQSKILEAKVAGLGKTKPILNMIENEEQMTRLIKQYRKKLVISKSGKGDTLNSLLNDFAMAKLEVKIAEEMLSASLQSLAQVRRDAANSKSVFQVVVPPSVADQNQHPNIIKSMFVAFLIFTSLFFFIRVIKSYN